MAKTGQTKKKPTGKNKKPAARKTGTTKKTTAAHPPAGKTAAAGIYRYLLGFFAVFLLITFFPQIDSGFLGGVREVLKGLFGFGYYLFPFLLLLLVFFWSKGTENRLPTAKFVLATVDFLLLLCLIHLIAVKGQNAADYSAAVKLFEGLYENGKVLKTGGAVGGFVCALITRGIGWIATAVFASLGVFVCTVLLCGSTPMATLRAIVRFFRDLSYADEQPADPPVKVAKETPTRTVKPTEPVKEAKRKVPSVLVDDRRITDDLPTKHHADGKHRFLLPDEEEEEVFSRVPTKLFQPDFSGLTDASGLTETSNIQETPQPEPADAPLTEVPGASNPDEEPDNRNPAPSAAEEAAMEAPTEEALPWEEAPAKDTTEPTPEENAPAEEELPEETTPLEVPADAPAPYVFPPLSLLAPEEVNTPRPSAADVAATSRKLESVLESFKVKAHVIGASFGPTVTQYEVQPETGVRVKQIANLADDLALHLAAASVRIENIPGKSAIGIEIPNSAAATVRLRGLIETSTFRDSNSRLLTALGEDVSGNPVYLDIAKMPHLMIAGATGMGKSVCMNSLIVSLLYHASPDEVKFIMIDPKKVEMADYNGIPHLLVPVINDVKKAAGTLNWACVEMEKRYSLIQEVAARNLGEYNTIVKDDPEREQQPHIVIFIDELADLMMTAPDDVETSICRLAQKARAAGIHLVLGTQRPTVDVITGLIKANIPSRIAFKVTAQVDSRTILDVTGAEKLLGRGDMLYYPVGAMKPIRVQGTFVDGKSEVVAVTEFIKKAATTSYDETIISEIEKEAKLCGAPKHSRRADGEEAGSGEQKLDEKMVEALELAIDTQNISTSMIQTRLGLGYARAARIVGVMEQKGFIGPFDAATKKRKILITREELMEMKLGKADADEDA